MPLEQNKNNGAWLGPGVLDYHKFDQPLCDELCTFFEEENATKIYDFGCGDAKYVEQISESMECKGYDANPDTPDITSGLGSVLDLSIPIKLRPADWVLSIEVGNHIPSNKESIFIENLDKSCKKGLVISWAIKSQKGSGQLNKQDNKYIIDKFKEYNYIYDIETTNRLRKICSLPWLRKSLMVFRK